MARTAFALYALGFFGIRVPWGMGEGGGARLEEMEGVKVWGRRGGGGGGGGGGEAGESVRIQHVHVTNRVPPPSLSLSFFTDSPLLHAPAFSHSKSLLVRYVLLRTSRSLLRPWLHRHRLREVDICVEKHMRLQCNFLFNRFFAQINLIERVEKLHGWC